MAKMDKYKENNTKKMKSPEKGVDDWTGMNPDGKSKNTFGPEPMSTPNKVGAEDFKPKKGKGNITGGIEEADIFTSIEYTGNTTNAGKKDFKSVDKGVWESIKHYTTTPEGMPDDTDGGVFGTAEYAAGMKDKTVSGMDEMDESDTDYLAPAFNPTGKRHLKPEANFNGENPTSVNVGRTKSPFRD